MLHGNADLIIVAEGLPTTRMLNERIPFPALGQRLSNAFAVKYHGMLDIIEVSGVQQN